MRAEVPEEARTESRKEVRETVRETRKRTKKKIQRKTGISGKKSQGGPKKGEQDLDHIKKRRIRTERSKGEKPGGSKNSSPTGREKIRFHPRESKKGGD